MILKIVINKEIGSFNDTIYHHLPETMTEKNNIRRASIIDVWTKLNFSENELGWLWSIDWFSISTLNIIKFLPDYSRTILIMKTK